MPVVSPASVYCSRHGMWDRRLDYPLKSCRVATGFEGGPNPVATRQDLRGVVKLGVVHAFLYEMNPENVFSVQENPL